MKKLIFTALAAALIAAPSAEATTWCPAPNSGATTAALPKHTVVTFDGRSLLVGREHCEAIEEDEFRCPQLAAWLGAELWKETSRSDVFYTGFDFSYPEVFVLHPEFGIRADELWFIACPVGGELGIM